EICKRNKAWLVKARVYATYAFKHVDTSRNLVPFRIVEQEPNYDFVLRRIVPYTQTITQHEQIPEKSTSTRFGAGVARAFVEDSNGVTSTGFRAHSESVGDVRRIRIEEVFLVLKLEIFARDRVAYVERIRFGVQIAQKEEPISRALYTCLVTNERVVVELGRDLDKWESAKSRVSSSSSHGLQTSLEDMMVLIGSLEKMLMMISGGRES
ncbi:50S ribosomal protein L11, partial [Striga asiatica]